MSRYSEMMKQAFKDYQKAIKTAAQAVDYARENYGNEGAEWEEKRQEEKVKQARTRAENTINSAYAEGREYTERWATIDGSRLTDDLKLFDAGMVTPDVFEQLKARYKDNATMSAALKAHGEKLNAKAAEDAAAGGGLVMAEPYNVRDIVTGEIAIERMDKMQKRAIDILDMIDHSGKYSDSWNAAMGDALGEQYIENFSETPFM